MPILEMQGIAKAFPGVIALDGVEFDLEPGELHALLGENGAGKSTLMKILGGVIQPDRGHMTLRGQPYAPQTPHDAQSQRIGFIHQELNLAENLSVIENVLMGRLPARGAGLVDFAEARRIVARVADDIGFTASLDARVSTLSVGMRQMVEIARVLAFEADIVIMDEPTAALSQREAEHLFEIIRRLRAADKAIIYISHRMEEVFALSNRLTVLRDGKSIRTIAARDCNPDEAIRLMVGREPLQQFPERHPTVGAEVLRVEGLGRGDVVQDVSFTLHAGEILGLAGLVGAGRTEIARLLCGADRPDRGQVFIEGKPVDIRSPIDAIAHRLAYAPEDRKTDGLVLGAPIQDNLLLASMARFARGGFLQLSRCRQTAEKFAADLRLRAGSVLQNVKALSGGNQQKVLIGKWLVRGCNILVLDEPTRGVDIGARAEIYRVIDELATSGAGVLLISSDLPELLGLSDRVAVIRQGRLVATYTRAEATPETVMAAAFGGPAAAVSNQGE